MLAIFVLYEYNNKARVFRAILCDGRDRRHIVHREVKQMTNYEVMFIIDPTLEEAKKEATIETVQGIIAKDGEVVKTDVMGMKKLAYPIAKHEEGYYVVVEFKANPTLPYELNRKMKISDAIIRHMIINQDEL